MQKLKNKIIRSAVLCLSLSVFFIPGIAMAADCTDQTQKGLQQCLKGNPIVKDLNSIVDVLSAGVGVVVVGVIVLGGIQYIMAGDSADSVTKAKQRITNGFLALLIYLLIFGFLQWLVPGGVFSP